MTDRRKTKKRKNAKKLSNSSPLGQTKTGMMKCEPSRKTKTNRTFIMCRAAHVIVRWFDDHRWPCTGHRRRLAMRRICFNFNWNNILLLFISFNASRCRRKDPNGEMRQERRKHTTHSQIFAHKTSIELSPSAAHKHTPTLPFDC